VTDASGAHLRFQGPEPAVCRRCLTCYMRSHSITCHPIRANPSLPYIWEEGQTSSYYCHNLPNLYQFVLLGEQRHMCEQLAQGRYLAVLRLGIQPATSGLQVRHVIPRLHDRVNIEQTSSKCIQNTRANCSTSARRLLDVC